MTNPERVLRKHKLVHLGELRIHENILGSRFPETCAMGRCNANCCQDGVWTDLVERDTILKHADLIRSCMDPNQEQDPARWFDPDIREDKDFPSGRAASTEVLNGSCIFLNSDRRCVLQKASENRPLDLKPFFCTAFPVTIDHGELQIDDGYYHSACCTLADNGVLNVFDVCGSELRHVLGEEGFRELEQLATG